MAYKCIYNDMTTSETAMREQIALTNASQSEIYECSDSFQYRTRHQDEEISDLKRKLSDKKKEKDKDLDNLIAYYYSR